MRLKTVLTYLIIAYFAASVSAKEHESPEEKLSKQVIQAQITIKKLRDAADAIDDNYHIGTAYNEVNSRQHFCYALGSLLDQGDSIRHLNINNNSEIRASNSDDAHALRVEAQSLENFIHSAKYAKDLSKEEKIIEWNLDCVGHFKIPGKFIASDKKTFYLIKNNGKILQVLGEIESGFVKKLQQAIDSNPEIKIVALGSGGGLIEEALTAGRYIRSKNLETTLWGNCYSACPLVFLGGTNRTIMSPYPYLGFHKIYTSKGAVPNFFPIYQNIARYAESMGASSNFILKNMLSAEPNQMRMIRESSDLCKFGIATWIQRVC